MVIFVLGFQDSIFTMWTLASMISYVYVIQKYSFKQHCQFVQNNFKVKILYICVKTQKPLNTLVYQHSAFAISNWECIIYLFLISSC